jgi:hypothetical protein
MTPTYSPVASFLDKWGLRLEGDKKQTFLQSVMKEVFDTYSSLSTDLLRSAMELEESLKSRKLQRHTSSRATTGGESLSDTEKMRLQLLLDLQEMQRCVECYWLQTCDGRMGLTVVDAGAVVGKWRLSASILSTVKRCMKHLPNCPSLRCRTENCSCVGTRPNRISACDW